MKYYFKYFSRNCRPNIIFWAAKIILLQGISFFILTLSLEGKEIKRDTLLFAKKNPSLFLELVNDENVQLRNIGIKAVEAGIIALSSDNRSFTWASNNRKIMVVPFEENPYSALASFFKTDEGIEIYQAIEKRLK